MNTITQPAMARRPPIARGSPPRRRCAWLLAPPLLALALLLAACAGELTLRQTQEQSCSRSRLDAAVRLFNEARRETIKHYRNRVDQALHAAYYASDNSIAMARSIRRCPDFDRKFRAEAINLIRSDLLLQRLVKINMRDPDPLVALTLLQEPYHEIFKSDLDALIVGGGN